MILAEKAHLNIAAGSHAGKRGKNTIDLDLEEARLGLTGSPTWVSKIFTPTPRPKGKMFEGEAEGITTELVNLLKDGLGQQ